MRSLRFRLMWDILTWHHGTLSIAWWAVLLLIVIGLGIAGPARHHKH